jgi:tetratricopeptide (TPR) repeat protein
MSKLTLAPLAATAEQKLAAVLVGEDAGPGVLQAVRAGTEGNPLFLEERLFSMVELGALVGGPGAWRLAEGTVPEVPQVLERMVRARVDYLGAGARVVVRTASVIGTEPVLSLLSATSSSGDELPAHLAELASAGLLGELPGAAEPAYRFRHALIQEAIYRTMLRSERRRLHGRVAWALESLSEGRLPEVAAVLAHHFAAAGEEERAVHYFELAGDHAETAYANEEAIASYRAALDLLEAGASTYATVAHRLWYKLAGPTARIGRRTDERYALHQALALTSSFDSLTLARIHGRLAYNCTEDRRYDAAQVHFETAQKLLPDNPMGADQLVVDLWIVLMNSWSEHYRNQSLYAQELATLEKARPVVEVHGTLRQRSGNLFLIAKAQAELVRYRVTDEVLAGMRLAMEMVPDRGQQEGDGWQLLLYGYLAFLKGDVELAGEQAERALTMAEKKGEAQLRAGCMFFRPMVALRGHDVDGVRELGPLGVQACEEIGFPEWVANAKGTLAWLAYQDGRHDDVLELAAECDELMNAPHGPEVFLNWVRLWPVVAVHLSAGRVGPAIVAARQMLDPSQQRFEDELESLLISACEAWETDDLVNARLSMEKALELASDLRYF